MRRGGNEKRKEMGENGCGANGKLNDFLKAFPRGTDSLPFYCVHCFAGGKEGVL